MTLALAQLLQHWPSLQHECGANLKTICLLGACSASQAYKAQWLVDACVDSALPIAVPTGTNSADETADPCEGCLCSLIAAFGPALTASTTAAPGTVIQACVTAYITPITAAGVNVFDLTGVQSCPLTPAVIQQCQGPANATAVPVPLSNATAPGGVAVAPGVKPTASPAIGECFVCTQYHSMVAWLLQVGCTC